MRMQGQHFTSRDIIYTMTDLLVAEDADALTQEGVVKTVYDMAMGKQGQMLTCMEERLRQLDADAEITSFGQEINHETYSIAKSDAIIKGSSAENMRLGDTLANDQFLQALSLIMLSLTLPLEEIGNQRRKL